ncbi:MAG: Hsp20/alpha crystallin family protein [Candidatus Hydrogenedentes bacterium]|nr:Hsp20/alpha crystallin family protein [Candidatus Hydrogenedentota bacterium]
MKESTVPAKQETTIPDTREEQRTLAPPVDIFENDEGLVVVADLPGVGKDGLDVRVENDVLTIKAAAASDIPVEPQYREYRLLNFFRQFQLSDEVDQERIQAELKHGVLTLTLPKKEQAKPKQIAVKVS